MISSRDLVDIKSQISAAVLKKVPGVTGVGLHAQGITIYVKEDTEEIRATVQKAIASLNLKVQLNWQVTGEFKR